jgi:CubicO group peptidase (beta-lactamase class C family)
MIPSLLLTTLSLQDLVRPSDAELTRALEGLIAACERDGASGFLLVARGEERLLARGFGLADRERQRPWTVDTLSDIGSITKPFTAAAVMKLVEQGKLAVSDPIGKHLPDVPADKAGLTIAQLLTHSAGVLDVTRELRDDDWLARDDLVATVVDAPLRFEPGSRYEYNNSGYSLLAAIVERASGQGYERFLREALLAPAGMEASGYLRADPGDSRRAIGYRRGERWGDFAERMFGPDGPSWVLLGNGGLLSSPAQMQRWALALLDGKVLAPATVEELWTPRVDESNGAQLSFYGYGWALFDIAGKRVVTHNGGNGIYFADLNLVPDERLILFLQTNDKPAFPRAEELLFQVLRFALGGERIPD